MKKTSSSCAPIESADTAYKYKQLALEYITNVDDIIAQDDPVQWYHDYVEPMQSYGITWVIDAGPRVSESKGTIEVQALWTSLSEREFAYHTWSNFHFCTTANSDIVANFRYHGITREAGEIVNEGIFGFVQLTIKTDEGRADLITEVITIRNEMYTVTSESSAKQEEDSTATTTVTSRLLKGGKGKNQKQRNCADFSGKWITNPSSPMTSVSKSVVVGNDGTEGISTSEDVWLLQIELEIVEDGSSLEGCLLSGNNACQLASFDDETGKWIATGDYTPHPVVGYVTGNKASLIQIPSYESVGLVNANIQLEMAGDNMISWSLIASGVSGDLPGMEGDMILAAASTAHRA